MFGWRDRRARAAAKWLAKMGNESEAFDRTAFERWRDAHPENAKAFAETVRSWSLPLPVEATRYAATAGRDVHAKAEARGRRGGLPALALAASLLVGLIALAINSIFPASDADRAGLRLASPLVTADGQSRSYRLSDGSVAALGPDTELRIAYTPDARRLTLVRGEARFEVAHDGARRFVVKAGDAVVIARGTVFAVRFTPQGVKVALYRGAVDVVQAPVGRPTGAVRRLEPGDTITLRANASAEPAALPGKAGSNDRIVTFSQTPLLEAAVAFEARTGVRIVIDPVLRTETVTGGFNADDAEGFAAMIAAMFDLRVARGSHGEIMLSPRR